MKETLTKAITHRQFLKMCGVALLGAGASQMVVPPKPAFAYDNGYFNNLYATGSAGIGTTTPFTKLDVEGKVNVGTGTAQNSFLSVDTQLQILTDGGTGGVLTFWQSGTAGAYLGNRGSEPNFYITNTYDGSAIGTASRSITLDRYGNVGIGNTAPGAKLAISTTTGNDGVAISGSNSQNVYLCTNLGQGSYNGITQAGDRGIIYSGASVDVPGGGFVIAPWRSNNSGLRLDALGNVNISGEVKVNGILAIKSDGVAAQSYYAP